MKDISDNRSLLLFRLGGLLCFCIELFIFMFFGKHHVDEGYYHLIAHLTAGGAMPYRDYFYVQAPLYPYLYGVVFKFLGSGFIVARGFSAFLTLVTTMTAVKIADRLAGPRGGAVVLGLILAQPHTIYYLVIVKLYAAVALCISLAVWSFVSPGTTLMRYIGAVFWLSLGTGFRISLLPGILVLLAWGLVIEKRGWDVFAAAASSVLVLSVVFLPFYRWAGNRFLYGVYGYHSEKEAFSLFQRVYHVFFSLSMVARWYFLHILLIVLLISVAYFEKNGKNRRFLSGSVAGAGFILAAVAAAHYLSQVPYTYRYLVILIPAVSGLIGGVLAKREEEIVNTLHLKSPGLVFSVACGLLFISSGRPELSFFRGGSYAYLKAVAHQVSLLSPSDKPILSFNHSVAIEASRNVLKGYEMNALSYDPKWTEERCRYYHVMNVDMLERAIRNRDLGAILITKYSFIGNFPGFYNPGETGARPRIMAAIKSYYVKTAEFPHFGYLDSDAELYLPEYVSSNKEKSSVLPDVQLVREIDSVDQEEVGKSDKTSID